MKSRSIPDRANFMVPCRATSIPVATFGSHGRWSFYDSGSMVSMLGHGHFTFRQLAKRFAGEDKEILEARNAWRSYLSKLGSVKGTIKSSHRTVGNQLITSNTVEVAVGRDTRYQKTLISASNANSPVISTDAFAKTQHTHLRLGNQQEQKPGD